MTKVWHYLRPNWTTKIPRRHICVATVAQPRPAHPKQLRLWTWAAVALDIEAGAVRHREMEMGTTSHSFWATIHRWLSLKCKTWVWGDPPTIIDGSLHMRPVRMVGLHNWVPGDIDALWAKVYGPEVAP